MERPELLLAFPGSGDLEDPLLDSLRRPWRPADLVVHTVALNHHEEEEALEEQYLHAIGDREGLILGGFSLGARIAVKVAQTRQPRALLCLAYPFHRRGEPQRRHGLQLLQELRVPTLIVQGSRDAHGTRQEVSGYDVPRCVQICWIDDANHRFAPRKGSSATKADNVRSAAKAVVDFLARVLV